MGKCSSKENEVLPNGEEVVEKIIQSQILFKEIEGLFNDLQDFFKSPGSFVKICPIDECVKLVP